MLIDALSGLYRCYYGSNLTFNSHHQPVNALRKYLTLVDQLVRDYPCDEIVFCEDAPRYTLFRQNMFQGYKGGRKEPPQELSAQKSILCRFLREIGFPVIGAPCYEADDVIGTMSRQLSEDGCQVMIYSSDKDMYQLLTNDRIGYIRHNPNLRATELLYRDDIRRQYGYWPEQVVDLKIMTGDSSDNIPGIPGIRIQTAAKLLQQYRSLDGIIASDSEDKHALLVKEYASHNQEKIKDIRALVTIVRTIDNDLISKQLAERIHRRDFFDAMRNYEVIDHETFENMSFYAYLWNRMIVDDPSEKGVIQG